ncbi:MAG: methyltransferase domain-containing protein [Ilumatobacteraceae bacterium]
MDSQRGPRTAVDGSSRPGDVTNVLPDIEVLRSQVRDKYRQVAVAPTERYHFHTGRPLAARLGYDPAVVDGLPDRAVESLAGVGNPFSLRDLQAEERVVDVGSGAGFDSFVAAAQVGPLGHVVGVDMTAEMLAKSRQTAATLGHVEFRDGFAEELPVEDGWADVVIGDPVDTFAGAEGEASARTFEVFGFAFVAQRR